MDNKCDYLNKNVNSAADNDDEAESEPTKKKKSCIYAFFVALVTVHICGLIGVTYFAFSKGSPAKILNPTNRKGEQCGHGNQTGKPNLLYFDLTQCAGLSVWEGGCPTPQVCVAKCPNTYWSSVQGKAAGLQQFCKEMGHWNTTGISQLVAERSCPAYLLPSKTVLGRCVPVAVLGGMSRDEEGRAAAKISAMQNTDGHVLLLESLMKGMDYVMDTLDARRYDEKILVLISVYWWIILMTYMASLFLSLTWTLLLKVAAKAVLWTSTVFCIPILVAWAVFSFSRYRNIGTGKEYPDQEEIIITGLSIYPYNKIMWLVCGIILLLISLIILTLGVYYKSSIIIAINHIHEACKAFSCVKIVFFTFLKCLVQVFIISFSLFVSIFLASTGSAEYRIIDACSSETCFNNNTGNMFSRHDSCNQENFAECTGCPHAQCVFHKFGTYTLAWWLQGYTLVGTLGLLFFVHYFKRHMMTGSFRNISCVGFLNSNDNFRRADLRTWLPSHIDQKNVWGENIWMARFKSWKLLFRNSDGIGKVTKLIIISAKICITGIAITIAFILLSSQFDNYLDVQLNNQYGFISILIFGVYLITSSFLDIYNIEVDRDMVEGIDNHGSVDVELTNNADFQTIHAVEENTISFDVNRNFGQRMENKKLNSTDYTKDI